MSITFSKVLSPKFISSNNVQLSNMLLILFIFNALNFDKSTFIKFSIPKNKKDKVFKLSLNLNVIF